MKTGLVLEGGAMRGMYTAGVLDVFVENGINVDIIAGVSAGALFGPNYLSKQVGRVIRYNKRFNQDKDYLGIRPLLKEGNIIAADYAFNKVPRELDPFDNEAFMESGVPFFAVCTDVDTGKAEYIEVKDVFKQMEVLRASGSMPMVSKPVRIGDKRYLDGAISDNIPCDFVLSQGADKLIVILTRDREYRKKPSNKALLKAYSLKYPAIAKNMSVRHIRYNDNVEYVRDLEREGKAFVICPSEPIDISRTEKNPDKLQATYELGRKDALNMLDDLRAFMA